MKKFVFICFIFLIVASCYGQNRMVDSIQLSWINLPNTDSLERLLAKQGDDTIKANLLSLLSINYAFNQADTSIAYGRRGIRLSEKLGYKRGIAFCTGALGWGFWGAGNYSQALRVAYDALRKFEEMENEEYIGFTYTLLGAIYRDFGDYKRALAQVQKSVKIFESLNSHNLLGYANTGSIYDLLGNLDSASYYIRKAMEIDKKVNEGRWGWLYYLQGNIHRKMGEYDSALDFYHIGLNSVTPKDIIETYNGLAILFREIGNMDSSIFYASEVIQRWRHVSYQRGVLQAANILAENYKIVNQRDSLIKYLDLSKTMNDSLFNQANERAIQNMAFNEQLRQDEIVREQTKFRNQLKMYGLLALGFIFLIIALLLWRNNQNRKKAYALLQHQKLETDFQKTKVEQTLSELKSTQAQLIQSEKMASLGELTAGIAHEIQNPLNFVNNFSDVNKELVDELKSELAVIATQSEAKGKQVNMQLANEIADTIKDNEDKINQHGKRADAIVRGMLQHSRISSGQKELTDINALADEYLRLAYHGLRAKDKSFNAEIETKFDPAAGKINIVPQEIGRVILNLVNNAFYAVSAKALTTADGGYEPTVVISTKKLSDKVEIKVSDNGIGISQKLLDKIFQPFFTTKPAGQGTGLGLSLAYDIVTKGHGGKINVVTNEGSGSEFVIELPLS